MASDFIKNYFGFNRQQRSGLYLLILISFLLLIIRVVYPTFMSPGKIIVKNLPLIERKLDSNYKISKKFPEKNYSTSNQKFELFIFDPNTVSLEQLLQLGFGEKRAATFLKFRKRGFVFKEKKDLQKIYGISGKFYETLAPYILIENKSVKPITVSSENIAPKETPKPKKVISIIELNSADSASLETLNGIGATYAKRILKYRSMLGGYVGIEQLKEVYGFNDELFEKIKAFVSVDLSLVKKINLNKDDFKTINKHPYLSYEITKIIFNRRRKEPITSVSLKDILNNDTLYQKLIPYLDFD